MVDTGIYRLQKLLKESNIELIFSGTFSQGLIEELGEALKARLMDQKVAKSKISTTFFIFIELAQNIKNYFIAKENSAAHPMIAASGVIAISRNEQDYCVNSGNIVFNKDIAELKEKLDKVLSMGDESLKHYFKEMMKREIDKETGTAGLGLVQLARKASRPIRYQFEPVDNDFSFYTLTVTV